MARNRVDTPLQQCICAWMRRTGPLGKQSGIGASAANSRAINRMKAAGWWAWGQLSKRQPLFRWPWKGPF